MQSTLRKEQIWLAVGSLMIMAVVALAVALIYTKIVMIPFILAVFITMVVAPVVDYQVIRLKVPQWLGVVLALIVVILCIVVLGMLLMLAVNNIIATAKPWADEINTQWEGVMKWLSDHNFDLNDPQLGKDLKEQLPSLITQTVGTGTSLLASGVLIIIFVIFLLSGRDSHHIRHGLHAEIETAVRQYIIMKFVISAVTGFTVWLILYCFGLSMAFVFGLLTFLLNFIPNIGPFIATLLPLPLAIAQFGGGELWAIIGVVAIPGTIHTIVGNVIEPKLMGSGLELHPITILLALAFWGLIWGYVGMVLSVPITAIIRIILIRYETTRVIGNLLGGKLPDEKTHIVPA